MCSVSSSTRITKLKTYAHAIERIEANRTGSRPQQSSTKRLTMPHPGTGEAHSQRLVSTSTKGAGFSDLLVTVRTDMGEYGLHLTVTWPETRRCPHALDCYIFCAKYSKCLSPQLSGVCPSWTPYSIRNYKSRSYQGWRMR